MPIVPAFQNSAAQNCLPYGSRSEQGGEPSHRKCSWDQFETINTALSAKFDCPKSSALGGEFLRRHRKNMGNSLESSRCTGDHLWNGKSVIMQWTACLQATFGAGAASLCLMVLKYVLYFWKWALTIISTMPMVPALKYPLDWGLLTSV